MKTFNFNPSDLLYFFYYESLRRVCRRFYLSPRVPQALGRWEFSVFSFTIQIWYDKWRRHDFSIKTHLSANENALIKNCVLQESVKSFLTLNFTLYSRIDIVFIWNSLLTKGSIIFPTATPIKRSLTIKWKFGRFVLTVIFMKNFTTGYQRFIKLTCLLHLNCTFLVRKT